MRSLWKEYHHKQSISLSPSTVGKLTPFLTGQTFFDSCCSGQAEQAQKDRDEDHRIPGATRTTHGDGHVAYLHEETEKQIPVAGRSSVLNRYTIFQRHERKVSF